MNLLTSVLPTKIEINNEIYDINYDFRTIINIILAFEDEELTYEEQLYIMINNLYKQPINEENLVEAIEKGIKFINFGEEKKESSSSQRRIYSFAKDGNYIFSGINMTHNIDLNEKSDLHWWKFGSLFMDMSNDCMFGELTYYRTRKNEGKLTSEEKKNYKKIKDIVDLDYTKKTSEARKKFFEQFNKSKK